MRTFPKKNITNLKLAINRAKRLFASGSDQKTGTHQLTHSKDTVYLEQLLLLEKLKQAGLDKYAFVGGANIATLITLAKIGFFNPNDIKKPDYYSLKIWEREKEKYAISSD